MNLDTLKASLRLHEGVSHRLYQCTSGAWSIGVGRNLDAKGLSGDEIALMLDNDISDAIFDLDREHHGWRNHSSGVQNVLIELMFNIGAPRFATFVRMLAALDMGDYDTAADELLDSLWADQVGERSETLSLQMRRG